MIRTVNICFNAVETILQLDLLFIAITLRLTTVPFVKSRTMKNLPTAS